MTLFLRQHGRSEVLDQHAVQKLLDQHVQTSIVDTNLQILSRGIPAPWDTRRHISNHAHDAAMAGTLPWLKCRPLRVRIPKKHRRVPIFENIFGGHFRKQPQLRGKPSHQTCRALQDAGVTARRPLDFKASRAVRRLTQVRRGRGAKRGELRGAARARAWPRRCPRGGVGLNT